MLKYYQMQMHQKYLIKQAPFHNYNLPSIGHLIVVGELDYKVIRLRSVADHRLGPLSVVGPVAGGGAALLELLMSEHLVEIAKLQRDVFNTSTMV